MNILSDLRLWLYRLHLLGGFILVLQTEMPLRGDGLPSPWLDQDIGAVGQIGGASFTNGSFSIVGSGTDIQNNADSFHFVYQPLLGDGEIVARVVNLQNTHPWAKAGVMVRESLAPNSRYMLSLVSAGHGSTSQSRIKPGALTRALNLGGPGAPFWVRVVRNGASFSSYVSNDGSTWQLTGSAWVPMNCQALAGLAVTAHNNTTLCTAVVDHVSISNVRPAVSILSIEPNSGFYTPTNLSLIASACDPIGGVSAVKFYAGTKELGQAAAEPYTLIWTNAGTGSFSLTARATVHGGLSVTSNPVAITILAPGRFNPGYLKREVYRDILGGTLNNLTNNLKFPDHPDFVGFVNSFEAPADIDEHYGQRLSGYCEPPLTGNYAFYISSDDQGALFLSTDESVVHKRLIASEPVWNGPREWINGENQNTRGVPPANISTNIYLQAGHRYYIEALMKQNIGGDNLAVTWQFAGTPPPSNGAPPIQGNALGIGNPYSLSIVHFGGNVLLSWTPNSVALEQANTVSGPWATVPGGSSPWPITPGGTRRFYRLRAL